MGNSGSKTHRPGTPSSQEMYASMTEGSQRPVQAASNASSGKAPSAEGSANPIDDLKGSSEEHELGSRTKNIGNNISAEGMNSAMVEKCKCERVSENTGRPPQISEGAEQEKCNVECGHEPCPHTAGGRSWEAKFIRKCKGCKISGPSFSEVQLNFLFLKTISSSYRHATKDNVLCRTVCSNDSPRCYNLPFYDEENDIVFITQTVHPSLSYGFKDRTFSLGLENNARWFYASGVASKSPGGFVMDISAERAALNGLSLDDVLRNIQVMFVGIDSWRRIERTSKSEEKRDALVIMTTQGVCAHMNYPALPPAKEGSQGPRYHPPPTTYLNPAFYWVLVRVLDTWAVPFSEDTTELDFCRSHSGSEVKASRACNMSRMFSQVEQQGPCTTRQSGSMHSKEEGRSPSRAALCGLIMPIAWDASKNKEPAIGFPRSEPYQRPSSVLTEVDSPTTISTSVLELFASVDFSKGQNNVGKMKSLLTLTFLLVLGLLQLGVEAKKKDPNGPPKRLKVETTFTPPTCNRKSRKSKTGDRLKVNYSGRFWKDQDVIIDSNFKSGKPYEFNLGLGNVIAGWDRGLTKMCVGEKRVLTIPASQTNQGEALIYDVEVVGIDNAPAKKNTPQATSKASSLCSPLSSSSVPVLVQHTDRALQCGPSTPVMYYRVPRRWNKCRLGGMMHFGTLFSVLGLATLQVNALLRFACSQLVIERFDPLVTPGIVSPHLHQIVGGNAFNLSMDPSLDLPSLSTCTTCTFTEDFSNYWTAVLFFRHANGTFERVPQIPEQMIGPARGGITVYYSQPQGGGKVTAFKKGFRMIVGDPMLRSLNSSSPETASLNYRCLAADDSNGGPVAAPGTSSKGLDFEDWSKCEGGIRSEITFPNCWDGVRLDMEDHKSHMAYGRGGKCPSTHPVAVPSIFLEIVWDTTKFAHLIEKGSKERRFVWSMGDPTGYGVHGDYIFGWQGDALQRAMDTCNSYGGPCPTLKTQTIEQANQCSQRVRVDEPVDGGRAQRNELCGTVIAGRSAFMAEIALEEFRFFEARTWFASPTHPPFLVPSQVYKYWSQIRFLVFPSAPIQSVKSQSEGTPTATEETVAQRPAATQDGEDGGEEWKWGDDGMVTLGTVGDSDEVTLGRDFQLALIPTSAIAPSCHESSTEDDKENMARCDDAICSATSVTYQRVKQQGGRWRGFLRILQENAILSVMVLNKGNAHDRRPALFSADSKVRIPALKDDQRVASEEVSSQLHTLLTDTFRRLGTKELHIDVEKASEVINPALQSMSKSFCDTQSINESASNYRASGLKGLGRLGSVERRYQLIYNGLLRYPNLKEPCLVAYGIELHGVQSFKLGKGGIRMRDSYFDFSADVNMVVFEVFSGLTVKRMLKIASSKETGSLANVLASLRELRSQKVGRV
ncbi:hypothetical protein NMY22_g6420 [Coprinellus aureogranulatus]|nr:hypothetical protein NMY22_g6420 [Coprinellus aureogranulatus]